MPQLIPSPEKFYNVNTGMAVALAETTGDIFANTGGWYAAQTWGVLAANTAAVNTTNFNILIDTLNASPNVGGVIFLPTGQIKLNALNAITANNIIVLGQGSFVGGTELLFENTTGDCITLSTRGHQRIQSVYITSDVIRTSGFAITVSGACFRPMIKDVRIDYHFNGIYLKACTEAIVQYITLRYIIGTRGILGGGTTGDLVSGWRLNNITTDCPYPVSTPTVAKIKTWAITTAFNSGDVINNNGNIYQCSTGGTSAGAGTGPSGVPGTGGISMSTTTITDGTAVWKYVCNGALRWITQDSGANSL
jgi:hypothetical protein